MARYGRVTFSISYVVDLDDPEMIADAKDAIAEDAESAVRHGEVFDSCKVSPDDDATEQEIHDFLIDSRADRVAE